MMKGNTILIEESKAAINQCEELLTEISSTCCMPERSTYMTEAFDKLNSIRAELELATQNTDSIHNAISDIGGFGSIVGYLYATCCTEIRQPLYQSIFKELNGVHGKLWQYMGHSH